MAQVPPPYGGQTLMIKSMLSGNDDSLKFYHVDVKFSKKMNNLGHINFSKLIQPFIIFFKVVYVKFRYNINIIYYPPSGQNYISILKDIVLLCSLRWLFNKTVFHFHAAGTCIGYNNLGPLAKYFFKVAFFNPDLSIELSENNPKDGKFIKSKNIKIIPNGIDDYFLYNKYLNKKNNNIFNILFVGLICESKGILLVVEAAKILKANNIKFKLTIVGDFISNDFKILLFGLIDQYNLISFVNFRGVLLGNDKFIEYLEADVFCFPSFFESESFGIVAVEAMQFKVPVIISKWRGLSSLIEDGVEGLFLNSYEPQELVDKITYLINHPDERARMGANGRLRYLKYYTSDIFFRNITNALNSL